jgi:RNA polymerase sigma-70 factor (ECF subfamily)
VVQDCWLIAVRRIASFDPSRGSFEHWLRGIASKVLHNHRRRWRRDGSGRDADAAVSHVSNRGDAMSGSDLAEKIGLVMTSLPERFQAVLRAKYEEHLTVLEISQRWKRSEKAIESLLSRARTAFREAYARRDGAP